MDRSSTKRKWAPVRLVVWPSLGPNNGLTHTRLRFITRRATRMNGTNVPMYTLADMKCDPANGRLAIVRQAPAGRVALGGRLTSESDILQTTDTFGPGMPIGIPWELKGTVVLIRALPSCIPV